MLFTFMTNPFFCSNFAQRIQFWTSGWHITNLWKITLARSNSLYLKYFKIVQVLRKKLWKAIWLGNIDQVMNFLNLNLFQIVMDSINKNIPLFFILA